MKKEIKIETKIIIFYILFFAWLYIITFLTGEDFYLTAFTSFVVAFYFAILRQRGDIEWFIVSMSIPILMVMFPTSSWKLSFQPNLALYMPIWHPLAWGMAIVALKRFANLFIPRYP